MSDPQIHSLFAHNPKTINGTFHPDDYKRAVAVAAAEHNAFHNLTPEQAEAAQALFERQFGKFNLEMEALAKAHDLSDAQITGLYLKYGYGMCVDTVDHMRSDDHPALRVAYLATVLRIMQFHTMFGTPYQMQREGHVENEAVVKIMCNMVWREISDKPIEWSAINEVLKKGLDDVDADAEADADTAAIDSRKALMREALQALHNLITLMPVGSAQRVDAEKRYGEAVALFEKIHGEAKPEAAAEPAIRSGVINVETDAETPEQIAVVVQKQLSEVGVNVDLGKIVDAIKAAERGKPGIIINDR